LDGVGKFDVKIVDIRANADNNSTYIVGDIFGVVAPEIKDVFPKALVRLDSQETLAKSDKDRNVENGVGGQLVQLNLIDKKQTTKKFVDRDRKAADEEVNECYSEVDRRMWSTLISRKEHNLLVEQA
jgi:hypothetical protein